MQTKKRRRLLLLSEPIDEAAVGRHLKGLRKRSIKFSLAWVVPSDAEVALTRRQMEVLRLMALGLNTRAIATKLGRSPKTIETHRAQVMERIGVTHVPGLVRHAIKIGLLPVTWLFE